ncbi:MAG TPA: ankyrin repeat domain-containing protein, partial [Bacilli bacterium]|nr:ankyrin repeat domain-containing protein [Bacilli bacterium]
ALIENGCDINIGGELEQTPLHMAVINGNLEMVKFLINSGADYMLMDEKNNLPIDYAIDEGDVEIIKYFLTIQEVSDERMEKINKILEAKQV